MNLDYFDLFQMARRLTCLGHDKTVYFLNTHTRKRSSGSKRGNLKLSKLFADFVKALEQSRFDETYWKGTDVTHAYSAFMDYVDKRAKGDKPKRH